MEKITFINSKGRSIEIDKKPPLLLQFLGGTGGVDTEVQTQKSAFQDGSNYLTSVLNERILEMQVAILASSETELYELRKQLVSIFNSKLGKGELVYEYADGIEKRIECVVDMAPQFLTGAENRNGNYQKVIFDLIAPNPFWTDNFISGEILTQSVPLFCFDLELSDEFEFGVRGSNRTIINNVGDVETPVELVFSGPAANPKIINETTGEFIKIEKILLDGESLRISTKFGNKYVLFEDGVGNTINAFGKIDLDSTFWQLQVGENKVVYTADSGIDTASLIVSYRNRFVGV